MTTYRELKIKEAGGLVSVGDPRTSEALVSTEARQFGAAGSVLDNVPMRVHPAEQLLKYSVLWLDAAHSSAGSQTITNLGWGGSVLDARNGSTSGADSNDALFLDWTGLNYVYLPGVVGNYLSVPDAAALDITGDIDIRVQVAKDVWNVAGFNNLLAKDDAASNRSYNLFINSGFLALIWTANGSTQLSAQSTLVIPTANEQVAWMRATLDVNNGASGRDIKFFTSNDGSTWTQLGTTVTQAGVTSIHSGTAPVFVGARSDNALHSAGKFYRAQIYSDLTETNKVLDVDTSVLTSGAATSFTALTGQTVTINRSTAGRKAVAVVSPCWLFGTDDYMEVADNDLIDFGAADSFTVLAVFREWATGVTFGSIVNKRSSPASGWDLGSLNASYKLGSYISDGTNAFHSAVGAGISWSPGSVSVVAVRADRSVNRWTGFINANPNSTGVDISTVGNTSNATNVRIGQWQTGGPLMNMELLAVAVFRRALTATEITTLNTYYQSRIGG